MSSSSERVAVWFRSGAILDALPNPGLLIGPPELQDSSGRQIPTEAFFFRDLRRIFRKRPSAKEMGAVRSAPLVDG